MSFGLVDILLSHSKISVNNRDKGGWTVALIISLDSKGKIKFLSKLSERNDVDWNVRNEVGATAAILAAADGQVEVLKIMSHVKNVDWNLKDEDGLTACFEAVRYNNLECVRILAQIEGIDWNIQTDADSVISETLFSENVECLRILSQVQSIDWNLRHDQYNSQTGAIIAASSPKPTRLLWM